MTLYECSVCGVHVPLVGTMGNTPFCPECFDNKRKQMAKPGLVEVVYGIKRGEELEPYRGYAYDSGGLELKIGDVVLVPPTPFNSNQAATVVGLFSAYGGPVKQIVRKLDESELVE